MSVVLMEFNDLASATRYPLPRACHPERSRRPAGPRRPAPLRI